MPETVETLQEKINNRADSKCDNEVYKAFENLRKALGPSGALWVQMEIGSGPKKVNAHLEWFLSQLESKVKVIGKPNYRKAETVELLEKLDAVQQHIETLQQQ